MISDDSSRIEKERALSRLIGARLTSVQFILNYLILGFDERRSLTTLVWPQIRYAEDVLRFTLSFDYEMFVVARPLPNFPRSPCVLSDDVKIDLVRDICLVLISAYDREGLVVSEIEPKAAM